MFAVVRHGLKQYLVRPGQKLRIEKVNSQPGEILEFNEVLLVFDGDGVDLGKPLVKGLSVSARILKNGRAKKITVLRYHSKNRYRKKKGHRQPFTEVEIVAIK